MFGRQKGDFDYALLGNARVLGVFPGLAVGPVLYFYDAHKMVHLPAITIAFATPAKRYAAGEITGGEYKERRAILLRDVNTKQR